MHYGTRKISLFIIFPHNNMSFSKKLILVDIFLSSTATADDER